MMMPQGETPSKKRRKTTAKDYQLTVKCTPLTVTPSPGTNYLISPPPFSLESDTSTDKKSKARISSNSPYFTLSPGRLYISLQPHINSNNYQKNMVSQMLKCIKNNFNLTYIHHNVTHHWSLCNETQTIPSTTSPLSTLSSFNRCYVEDFMSLLPESEVLLLVPSKN